MRSPANQHQNGVQKSCCTRAKILAMKIGRSYRIPKAHLFTYLQILQSTLSSRESTVLIVLRWCVMLFLSTADRGRQTEGGIFLWSQGICKKKMVSTYQGNRAVSDELCRENRLSVVETDGHGKSYGDRKHEKEGSPTLRGMVTRCGNGNDRRGQLCRICCGAAENGVCGEMRIKAAHMTVRHKEAQKNIRLDKISPTSAKIRCGGTSGNCKHFHLRCSRNISSKQHLSHHADSRKRAAYACSPPRTVSR